MLLLPFWVCAQPSAPQGFSSPVITTADATRSIRANRESIQDQVNVLLARLAMPQVVHVAIVHGNSYLASVELLDEANTIFCLSLDDSFLESLSDEEVTAALAHELGHVWVFMHHPYLQTEKLANEIAMRLVPRDSLMRVCGKMWERLGIRGEMVEVLVD